MVLLRNYGVPPEARAAQNRYGCLCTKALATLRANSWSRSGQSDVRETGNCRIDDSAGIKTR